MIHAVLLLLQHSFTTATAMSSDKEKIIKLEEKAQEIRASVNMKREQRTNAKLGDDKQDPSNSDSPKKNEHYDGCGGGCGECCGACCADCDCGGCVIS